MKTKIKEYIDRTEISIRGLAKQTGIALMKLSLVFRNKVTNKNQREEKEDDN